MGARFPVVSDILRQATAFVPGNRLVTGRDEL